MTKFGKHEAANNDILAFLKDGLHVGNAAAIELDGQLGNEFKTALKEVRTQKEKARQLTEKVRDACRLVGEKPGKHHLFSAGWGEDYDKFVEYLNQQAALEQKAREGDGQPV